MAAVSPVGRAAGLEPLGLPAEEHAAGALYERHAPRVFAYCLSKLGRREDAEDAVQTTFLHAVRALKQGVVPAVEIAWLLGIARNVCLSRRESAGRRGRLELVCDPVDLERAAARQSRGDELIGLEGALARLPEQQRRAVLLRDWRGLSYEEVAAQLGVSLANAETLIFRGRRALAALLDETPTETRRRLASLGNVGSLFAAVKSAFTGAATVAKVAAAVTVVAASGAGIAAGTSVLGAGGDAPTRPASAGAPADRGTAPVPAAAHAAAIAPPPRRVAARPPAPPAPAASGPSASRPTAPPPPAQAAPVVGPDLPAAAPAPAPAAPAEAAPPAASPTVGSTVQEVLPVEAPPVPDPVASLPLPEGPVETPPAVESVVESLPAVTVDPSPLVPVQPVTVDPGTLLP